MQTQLRIVPELKNDHDNALRRIRRRQSKLEVWKSHAEEMERKRTDLSGRLWKDTHDGRTWVHVSGLWRIVCTGEAFQLFRLGEHVPVAEDISFRALRAFHEGIKI
jgi:hypothetical protein